jgi:hypothetical protein
MDAESDPGGYRHLPAEGDYEEGDGRLHRALRRLSLSVEQYETLRYGAWATKLGKPWPVTREKPSRAESAAHSRMLRTLWERGLIERLAPPPSRRTTHIWVTEEGMALLYRVPALMTEAR